MGRPLHSAAVVSSFFLFSSFILSSRRLDIYHTSTHDMALVRIQNTQCRSEMCCMWFTQYTGCKNSASVHHRTTKLPHRAISLQLRHLSTIENKLGKQHYLLHKASHYGERWLMSEIVWRVLGTPANFNGFRVLVSLLHQHCSTEVNQTLHDVWRSPALVQYTVSQ